MAPLLDYLKEPGMDLFNSPADVYRIHGGFLEQAVHDPAQRSHFTSAGVVVRFRYTVPEATIVLDCRQDPPTVIPSSTAECDAELAVSARDLHKAWLGEISMPMALARRKVKLSGAPSTLRKMRPIMMRAAGGYRAYLRANDLMSEES